MNRIFIIQVNADYYDTISDFEDDFVYQLEKCLNNGDTILAITKDDLQCKKAYIKKG